MSQNIYRFPPESKSVTRKAAAYILRTIFLTSGKRWYGHKKSPSIKRALTEARGTDNIPYMFCWCKYEDNIWNGKTKELFLQETITMNDIELRKYCLDKAIEILSWYKSFRPQKELHPLAISEILYRYLTTGKTEYFELPLTKGK